MKLVLHRTAERWQHLAWGEPTSDSEASVTPGKQCATTPSPAAIWRPRPPNRRGGKLRGDRDPGAAVCSLQTSRPDPRLHAITATQLAGGGDQTKHACVSLRQVTQRPSPTFHPKPDVLVSGRASRTARGLTDIGSAVFPANRLNQQAATTPFSPAPLTPAFSGALKSPAPHPPLTVFLAT